MAFWALQPPAPPFWLLPSELVGAICSNIWRIPQSQQPLRLDQPTLWRRCRVNAALEVDEVVPEAENQHRLLAEPRGCRGGSWRATHLPAGFYREDSNARLCGPSREPVMTSSKEERRKERQMFHLMSSEYLQNRPPDLCVIGQQCMAEERRLKSHYLRFSDVIEHQGGWECYQKDFLLLKTLFCAFVSWFIIGFLKKTTVFYREKKWWHSEPPRRPLLLFLRMPLNRSRQAITILHFLLFISIYSS